MVAVAERGLMRRGADVFESRRVLAAALIAPAVIFILLLVGTPFVLAIYLSFTDATAGSLSGTGSASTTSPPSGTTRSSGTRCATRP